MMPLVRETKYAETMEHVVEPYLASLRETIHLPLQGGGTLHTQVYALPHPRRAVVILHGYTESMEKFREMMWYFLQAGVSVFALDHRGHGYSVREVEDTSITHVERFDDYLHDLEQFMEKVVLPRTQGLDVALYAHSMGGAVASLALMEHPDWFDRAVLTAPMIAAACKPFPRFFACALGGVMCALGKGKERAFVGQPFDAERETYERSLTTSRERYTYYQKKRVADEHYHNCSPSYSWVREGMGVTYRLLRRSNCEKIRAKVLLIQSALDQTVCNPEQEKFVSMVPGARLHVMRQSKHEIYSSDDAAMREYIDLILDFILKEEA